jgi:hypothetical protein
MARTIWPLNLDLDGTNLHYATAQPLTLLDQGKAGVVAVFAASAGVPVELSFDAPRRSALRAQQIATAAGKTLVTGVQPGAGGGDRAARRQAAADHRRADG